MEQIPVLKLGEFLLVSIQVELHDELVLSLQDDLTLRIEKTRAKGVLIDISALEIVDSFIGRTLGRIAAMARVMDATTVLVGMRPAVAITLVELGMSKVSARHSMSTRGRFCCASRLTTRETTHRYPKRSRSGHSLARSGQPGPQDGSGLGYAAGLRYARSNQIRYRGERTRT